MSRARKGKVLARLKPEECGDVLYSLLERHPELITEAEEIALATVSDVDADAVAEDVLRKEGSGPARESLLAR